jgi:hypothetical protein
MLVHVSDRTLNGFLLEVRVDVLLFLPATILISASVVVVSIALVVVAPLVIFV